MLDQPTPEQVRAARQAAGLTPQQCSELLGLRRVAWAEYERGERRPSGPQWEMFLLLTGQHPHWLLVPRKIAGSAGSTTIPHDAGNEQRRTT